jgi:cytoskeleton protein RodZ
MALLGRIRSSFAGGAAEVRPVPSFETQSVEHVLRRQRRALDIDIGDAAAALKIKPAYLLAIEEGCPSHLPGVTYAVGFVRSYGEYLGLDSVELVR